MKILNMTFQYKHLFTFIHLHSHCHSPVSTQLFKPMSLKKCLLAFEMSFKEGVKRINLAWSAKMTVSPLPI